MSGAVFGLLSEFREEFTELIKNLLLVAGGFLVGYLLGGIAGWSLGRWVFRQKTPETLQRLGRPVCGTILALIVALIVFTGKGKPSGDGGDGKGTPSTDTNPGKNATPKVETNTPIDPKITTPKVDLNPAELNIRVTVLAGMAVPAEGKFYVIDDDSREQAKTLSELKRTINERKVKVSGKVTLVVLFPTDPNFAPPRDDKKVTDLTIWADEEAKIGVFFPTTR
jgi:hypothetical protein